MPPRPTLRIKRCDAHARAAFFQKRQQLRVGHADAEHGLRLGRCLRERGDPRDLFSGIGAHAHALAECYDRQLARRPRRRLRTSPTIKIVRLGLRRVNYDVNGQCSRVRREHAQSQWQRIGRTDHRDAREIAHGRRCERRRDARGLRVEQTELGQPRGVPPFEFAEFAPTIELRTRFTGARRDITQAPTAFSERGLETRQLAPKAERPREIARGRIMGQHRAHLGQIHGAQDFGPSEKRFQAIRRRGAGGDRLRDEQFGRDDAGRKHGLAARGRVFGERLAQATSGLARGHDDEPR